MTLRLCLTPLLVVAIISTTIFATPLPQQETSAAIEYTLDVSPLCDICKEWELVNSVRTHRKSPTRINLASQNRNTLSCRGSSSAPEPSWGDAHTLRRGSGTVERPPMLAGQNSEAVWRGWGL